MNYELSLKFQKFKLPRSVKLRIVYVIIMNLTNSMNGFSLNQFGSVMKFAIDLESDLAEYYQNSKLSGNQQVYKEEFAIRVTASLKRKKNIERSRRENVTEITLEPIEGLNSDDYKLNFSDFSVDGINKNEEIAIKFFSEAGPKINVLETRRVFKRCLKEHSNLNTL
ncbi:MAG: hypothetical protein HeimC2_14050 [Candidatus Heimdallarchaeota archaeon LC_2]|nr:MAG: hypothetical protein HeimC2_14050 [Candidatus Heimdallarchaeota archaeon LC_2]